MEYTNDPSALLFFKSSVCLVMLLAAIATHTLIRRLNEGKDLFASDPIMAGRVVELTAFINNMKWRRNVLTVGVVVAVATLNLSFSGWVLFFLFGFLLSMLVYVGRYLNKLKASN